MRQLAVFNLTIGEIQQAMVGTYVCTDNDFQTNRVSKLAKILLEVNEELTILAQYKAKANAARDARTYKPHIPDAGLLPNGSTTERGDSPT